MSRLSVADPEKASQQLERWCIERKRQELRLGIRQLLREHPGSRRLINRSLDWLLRSGQFKEALALALPRELAAARAIRSPLELGSERAFLWMSAIGRLSGWLWVARWLPEVATKAAKNPRERVLLVGEFEKARDLLEAALKDGSDERRRYTEDTERRRMPFEGLIGDPAGAVARFQKIDADFAVVHARAPRIYAISRLLLAELQVRAGDSASALQSFAEADRWYCEVIPEYQPLSRTQALGFKARVGLATEAELSFLAHYPGIQPFCRTPASERYRQDSALWHRQNPRPRAAAYEIDLPVGEWRRPGSERHAHLPLELRLLALLWFARDYGIHRSLLQALLWPDQWMIQAKLDDRLSKLIERLRSAEHGFKIEARDECAFLARRDWNRVFVDPFVSMPHRLRELAEGNASKEDAPLFNWEELLEGYRSGATQARTVLKHWIEQGWIARVGNGRSTRYQILVACAGR